MGLGFRVWGYHVSSVLETTSLNKTGQHSGSIWRFGRVTPRYQHPKNGIILAIRKAFIVAELTDNLWKYIGII